MKLEWRMSSDGERIHTTTPEGKMFACYGRIIKVWFISKLSTDKCFGILPEYWEGREFSTAEQAAEEMERWYFSKVKADPCES